MPASRRTGTVYLVGAGPGDPGLITARGRDLLGRAEVVIYDGLAPEALLRSAPPEAERLHVGKRPGRGGTGQEQINRLMIDRARRGRRVVRLKGGDPGLFGRAGEEMEALARARVPFEVVPGVTAALGAAAAAGFPLTDRRLASSVVFATGHEDPGKRGGSLDWRVLAGADTLVLYMAMGGLRRLAQRLLKAGRAASTPAVIVRWATRPDQRIVEGTLATIATRARAAGLGPPALLIAGEVVRLRRRRRTDRRPLRGRTIVVTRAREQAGTLSQVLRDRGARVIEAPAIAFAPPRSWAPVDRALRRLGRYRYVIFTSVNGVERFFERLARLGVDLRGLGDAAVIAIGPATAGALRERGLRAACVPEQFRAEGIVAALSRRRLAGAEVLIPRAAAARDLLVKELRRRGARVDVVPVYRTLPSREGVAEVAQALRERQLDLLTFTSSSTVEHFARKFRGDGRLLRSVPAAAIGPITARTARRHGFRVAVMPSAYTIPALVRAISRRFRNSPSGTHRGS
jgi:uroporphyrinogen III methyltransferase/synthase